MPQRRYGHCDNREVTFELVYPGSPRYGSAAGGIYRFFRAHADDG
jgi:hypothetical protein